ncbi:hypothetical protein GGR53DRAFT_529118, partial [Hypoxylon sp. FL1150]
DAFKAWKTHKGNPQSQPHKDLDWFAREVDKQYGHRDNNKPLEMRFVRDSSVWKVEAFINSLERRRDPLIPGSDIQRQIASPLYVVCSKNIKIRAASYEPSGGLKKANKLWGLVCCVLSMMGKHPRPVVVPIVRTWKRSDLPLAEILVTMIASSLVCQDGFNGHGPGTTTDGGTVDELKDAEKYVLVSEPHFLANMEATQKEMEHREQYLEHCNVVGNFPNARTQDLQQTVSKAYYDALATIDAWESSYKQLMTVKEELNNKVVAARTYVEYLRNADAIMRAIAAVAGQSYSHDDEGEVQPEPDVSADEP